MDDELGAALDDTFVRDHEDLETGGVDESHAGEIDDHVTVRELSQAFGKLPSVGHVDLAADLHAVASECPVHSSQGERD